MIKHKFKRVPLLLAIILFAIFVAGAVFSGVFFALKNSKSEFTADISLYEGNIGQMYEYDGISCLGTQDGTVVAFGADGQKLWENTAEQLGDRSAVRVLSAYENNIYAAFANFKIIAFDKDSGAVRNVYLARSESGVQIVPAALEFCEGSQWFALSGAYGQRNAIALIEIAAQGTLDAPAPVQDDMICEVTGIEAFAFAGGDSVYYANSTGRIYRAQAENFASPKLAGKTENGNALKGIQSAEGGFVGIDEAGWLHVFDENWETVASKNLGSSVSTAIRSGENFICKSAGGSVFLIDTGARDIVFTVDAGEDALILFSSPEMFAVSSGGAVNFYDVDLAVRLGLYSVLAWVFFGVGIAALVAGVLCALNATESASARFVTAVKKFGGAFWKHKLVYFSLIPVLAVIGIFCYVPMVWSIFLSFFDYLPGVRSVWVGLDNFKLVFQTSTFWSSCIPMFTFLLTDLVKALVPPIIFAECLIAIKRKKFSFWARCLLFIPGILPGVATTLLWMNGIFGEYGLVNQIASAIVPHWMSFNFLSNPDTSLPAIIMFGLPWVGSYLIFYGAVMGLPSSMYEASKLDGCGWFKRIFKLDLPLILPQIKYIIITTFIASVQSYTNMYIVSNGSLPTANELGISTPAYHMYYELMHNMNYGTASAMGVLLFLFLLVATIINFRMQSDKS